MLPDVLVAIARFARTDKPTYKNNILRLMRWVRLVNFLNENLNIQKLSKEKVGAKTGSRELQARPSATYLPFLMHGCRPSRR
jgi:hypothetical protein